MPAPTDPDRPQTDDEPVAPPHPPTELPVQSTPTGDDDDDETMRRADAANGEPDASE